MNAEPQPPHSAGPSCASPRQTAHERCALAPPKTLPILALSFVMLTPATAAAYIGPGAGLGALGSLLALLGAALLVIVGFVWYPVKRVMAKWKAAHADEEDNDGEQEPVEAESSTQR